MPRRWNCSTAEAFPGKAKTSLPDENAEDRLFFRPGEVVGSAALGGNRLALREASDGG